MKQETPLGQIPKVVTGGDDDIGQVLPLDS